MPLLLKTPQLKKIITAFYFNITFIKTDDNNMNSKKVLLYYYDYIYSV